MALLRILGKKSIDFSSSFAKLILFKSIGPPSNFKISSKRYFTPPKKKIQAIHCPQPVQIYTNNNKNFNKSQIRNTIHQKEKSFVNQVSSKFIYQSFRAIGGCTTQTHVFRQNPKFPKFGQAIAFSKNAKIMAFYKQSIVQIF